MSGLVLFGRRPWLRWQTPAASRSAPISRTCCGGTRGCRRATMRGEHAAHGADTEEPMLFMVIERFEDNDMLPIYKRVRDGGRMLPDGLSYVDSWVEPNFARCFQLMECDDLRLFQQWVLTWRGSGATFEIVPVVASKDTRDVVAPHLDKL